MEFNLGQYFRVDLGAARGDKLTEERFARCKEIVAFQGNDEVNAQAAELVSSLDLPDEAAFIERYNSEIYDQRKEKEEMTI